MLKIKDLLPERDKKVRIEFRLFEMAVALTILVFLFWTVFGFIVSFTFPMQALFVASGVLYCIIYWMQKKRVSFGIVSLIYFSLSFSIMSLAWLPGGGITGSVLQFILLLFVSGLLILPLRSYLVFIALTFSIVIGFSLYEIYIPGAAAGYANEEDRIRDISIAGFITISVLAFALYTFKKSFLEDRQQLKETVSELEIAKDKAETADQAKSQFLATISHEMRTPLNGIVGITEVLDDDKLDPEQKELIRNLKYSSDLLHSLISDILDLTTIEDGRLVLEEGEIDLKKETSDVLDLFKPRIDAKREWIKLTCEHSGEIPDIVIGDATRFRQILINLVNNAIKFTEKGSVKITSEVVSEDDYIVNIRFTIVDTGFGISEEDQKQLFNKFFRSASIKGIEGTGLGLAISKNLIELMDGKIGFHSTIGKGSTFYFEIPFEKKSVSDTRSLSSQRAQVMDKTVHILVVEDVRINRVVLLKLFSNLGLENIDVAENGEKAVEMAKEKLYDIIFMDIQMPVMNGVEATKAIFDYYKEEESPTIVALTANVMKTDQVIYRESGMAEILSKPINSKMLVEVLNRYSSK